MRGIIPSIDSTQARFWREVEEGNFFYSPNPTTEQENFLRRTMGCVRKVYNLTLAARTEAWYERQERVDYPETSSLLTGWKKTEDLNFRIGS